MSRKRKPHQPRRGLTKAEMINRNRVTYLYAKDEIESRVRSLKIQVWIKRSGEEATECLAKLAWIIGLATETEYKANGTTPRMRTLHGTLRMLHGWCLSGYTWQIDDPAGIDNALDLAYDTLMQSPTTALAMIPGADHLAACIRAHKVLPETIAGVEIYQTELEAA